MGFMENSGHTQKRFHVPPTEKGTAKVKLSLLASLPTYQLASVAQSQAQYTLPRIHI